MKWENRKPLPSDRVLQDRISFKRSSRHPVRLSRDSQASGKTQKEHNAALTFGWLGSPGEYMAVAWVPKELYDNLGPEREARHDDVPFHGHLLMDDDVPAEGAVGEDGVEGDVGILLQIDDALNGLKEKVEAN